MIDSSNFTSDRLTILKQIRTFSYVGDEGVSSKALQIDFFKFKKQIQYEILGFLPHIKMLYISKKSKNKKLFKYFLSFHLDKSYKIVCLKSLFNLKSYLVYKCCVCNILLDMKKLHFVFTNRILPKDSKVLYTHFDLVCPYCYIYFSKYYFKNKNLSITREI